MAGNVFLGILEIELDDKVKARFNCYASVTRLEIEMKMVQHGKTAKAKILIIEDETPVALLMVHVLSRVGCVVQVANSGERGIELAQENKFDLITLDIDLSDINGFEVCRELKQRHISRHTPIVFISGRPCKEDIQRSLEVGAVDYITKPFEVTDFIFRIISHARRAGNVLETV